MIPAGELHGGKEASFESPETKIISVALPALQSTRYCEDGAHRLNHLEYRLFHFLHECLRPDVCLFQLEQNCRRRPESRSVSKGIFAKLHLFWSRSH